jgi:hypothetical protein
MLWRRGACFRYLHFPCTLLITFRMLEHVEHLHSMSWSALEFVYALSMISLPVSSNMKPIALTMFLRLVVL